MSGGGGEGALLSSKIGRVGRGGREPGSKHQKPLKLDRYKGGRGLLTQIE